MNWSKLLCRKWDSKNTARSRAPKSGVKSGSMSTCVFRIHISGPTCKIKYWQIIRKQENTNHDLANKEKKENMQKNTSFTGIRNLRNVILEAKFKEKKTGHDIRLTMEKNLMSWEPMLAYKQCDKKRTMGLVNDKQRKYSDKTVFTISMTHK